jgi:hypothetical protein
MIPNVHEFDREIPAGKVLVAEYGTVEGERFAKSEVLATKLAGFRGKTEYRLEAVSAGWQIAGSMLRWDNGFFAVRFEDGNSRHGRGFKTYEEAITAFDKVQSY